MFYQFINDLRSGLSMKLLGIAMNVAPASERGSLAMEVRAHIQRVATEDLRSKPSA